MHTVIQHTPAPKGDLTAMLCREEEALEQYLSHTNAAIFEENIALPDATPAEAPVATITLTDYQRNERILMASDPDEDEDDDDDMDMDDDDMDDIEIEDTDLDADPGDDDLDDDLDLDDEEEDEDDEL